MKRTVMLSTLIFSLLFLSSCSPIASGVAVLAQDVTSTSNDRRSPGELIDDKNIQQRLNSIIKKVSEVKITKEIIDKHIFNFQVAGKVAAEQVISIYKNIK